MKGSSGMRKAGGGLGSAVVRNRPLGKTAKPQANAISPKGVSQIGSSMGNHATDRRGELRRAVEPLSAGRGYSTPVGPTNSLPVGVGKGYVQYGKSGSQQTYGPVAGTSKPQGREILRDFGPDSAAVKGR